MIKNKKKKSLREEIKEISNFNAKYIINQGITFKIKIIFSINPSIRIKSEINWARKTKNRKIIPKIRIEK